MISAQMTDSGIMQKHSPHNQRGAFLCSNVKPIKKKSPAERAKIKAKRKQNRH